MTDPDIERLRVEYATREKRLVGSDLYAPTNPVVKFTIERRQQAIQSLLKKLGIQSLRGLSILEIGCGSGGVLQEYESLGADRFRLSGLDLLHERLALGRKKNPDFQLVNANGACTPFLPGSFDIVMQYTALSSLLDARLRGKVAGEMMRLVKPGGFLVWYDFFWNPTNPQTHGITRSEMRNLFPGCLIRFQRVTLAPPIARRVVPVSWNLAQFLEILNVFNSHILATIHPPQTTIRHHG